MRAILFGGPLDRRVMDVPAETESMQIPANVTPRHARYERVADERDAVGPYARFDFVAIFSSVDTPLL